MPSDLKKLIRQDEQICPTCGRRDAIRYDGNGQAYCSRDGTEIGEKNIYSGPVSTMDSKTGYRTINFGTPESIASHDMGLATEIGKGNTDAHGGKVKGQMKSTLERMRTWDRRSQVNEPKDRNLRQAMSELDIVSDKLHLSEAVKERGAYIYRKALERGLVRGRSINGIMAASLYAACRESETPRTLKDLTNVSNIKKKDIARIYRLLLKELDMKMPVPEAHNTITRIANSVGHGSQVFSKPEFIESHDYFYRRPITVTHAQRIPADRKLISEKAQRRAREILSVAEAVDIKAGKDPMGLAAASLYTAVLIEGEDFTQKDVAEAAGVTEVTIRNRYKGIVHAFELAFGKTALDVAHGEHWNDIVAAAQQKADGNRSAWDSMLASMHRKSYARKVTG